MRNTTILAASIITVVLIGTYIHLGGKEHLVIISKEGIQEKLNTKRL